MTGAATVTPLRWLLDLLGLACAPAEGETVLAHGRALTMRGGMLRGSGANSAAQGQTQEVFGFKWHQRETFESEASLAHLRAWHRARYGDAVRLEWLAEHGPRPLLLDAGCGAGMTALELLAPALPQARYLGIDISDAIEVARDRFDERGFPAAFIQADFCAAPLAPRSVDVVVAEGVLHHTDSTERSLKALAALLKPGGRMMIYVYRKKGPIREFTDDLIREKLAAFAPEEAWQALLPLTKLGQQLGELDIELDLAEPIALLDIPAGKIDLQRFFYWHIFKAFYRADFTLEEMHHINFDWYAPRNAHRQTPEEMRRWCAEAGLAVEHEHADEAGITMLARKT